MAEYQAVHSSFELQLPDFKVERFWNQPKLDYTDVYNPNYGTKIQNDNIYDNLLETVSQQSNTTQQSDTKTNIGNFNLDAAVAALHNNVTVNLKTGKPKDPNKSSHLCARAVRMAMEAGGLNTTGRPNYGGNYGPYLQKHGWSEVKGAPQKGDIAVTKPHGTHSMGHISMYDGQKWISDFVQRDKFVYRSANDNNTTVYRYQG